MIEQTERSSVGGASRRGARPPGLEPDVHKKKSLASSSGFFFTTRSWCNFLLMKYGGTVISPVVFFYIHDRANLSSVLIVLDSWVFRCMYNVLTTTQEFSALAIQP